MRRSGWWRTPRPGARTRSSRSGSTPPSSARRGPRSARTGRRCVCGSSEAPTLDPNGVLPPQGDAPRPPPADQPGVNAILSRLPKLAGLPADVCAPRHRAIVALVWAHVPVIFLWSVLQGFPVWHAALDALPIAALALLANARTFSQTARSCVGAIALVTCSAIVVHVAGGAIAAHFHFFVVLPIIGLYG